MTTRTVLRVLGAVALAAVVLRPVPVPAATGSTAPGAKGTLLAPATSFEHLTPLGMANLGQLGAAAARDASAGLSPASSGRGAADTGAAPRGQDRLPLPRSPKGQTPARAPIAAQPAAVPDPTATRVSTATGAISGFSGLDAADSRFADNGNQLSFEPPDLGLCATGGRVLEIVNRAALAVFTDRGQVLVPPVAMNSFFGLPPLIDRQAHPVTFGPVMTDPQCLYDPQVGRWFLTIGLVATDPNTGAFLDDAAIAVAVSQTSDPTSTWALYRLDVNDVGAGGEPTHPGCPCFGDQPFIGADSNGFYITTNEFSGDASQFNGAQIYAISKWQLARAAVGGPLPTVVHVEAGEAAGQPSFSVRPANTPPGASYQPSSEYFLSNVYLDADNRLVAWALTHTERLSAAQPQLGLSNVVFTTEGFAQPPNVVQRPGPAPLGDAVGEPLNFIQSGDYRLQQVQFARGRLFATLDTGLSGGRAGVAWFVIATAITSGTVSATVEQQGYIRVAGDSLLYGAVAVNAAGRGVIAMGLAGPDYYPSAGVVAIDLHGVQGPIRLTGAGTAPEDGLSCYQAFYGPTAAQWGCLWGDYSAAVAEDGNVIITGSEYIPARPRAPVTNWGTFISRANV